MSILPLAGVPILPFVRRRRNDVPVVRRPPFPYYPPKKYRSVSQSSYRPYKGAVRVRKVRRPHMSARRPSNEAYYGGEPVYRGDRVHGDHVITHSTHGGRTGSSPLKNK